MRFCADQTAVHKTLAQRQTDGALPFGVASGPSAFASMPLVPWSR